VHHLFLNHLSYPQQVRIGIAGCGQLTQQVHLPCLIGLSSAAIVAIADTSTQRLNACAVLVPSALRFDSLEDMLTEPKLDAVLVATPTGDHARHASLVLAAGKALYLEKPMASSLSEAEQLLVQAQSCDALAMMGFNYRFNPLLIHAGKLASQAPIQEFKSTFSLAPKQLPGWKTQRQTGGGVLLDLASHHFDLISNHFGFKVSAVEATITSDQSEEDTASVTLYAPTGATALCSFSLCSGEVDSFSFRNANGSFGFSRYNPWSYPLLPPQNFIKYHLERYRSPWKEPSFRRSLSAWIQAIQQHTPPPVSLSDGLEAMRLIDAAERSSVLKRRVLI